MDNRTDVKCPICGSYNVRVFEDIIANIVCEDFIQCDRCQYTYEFMYGGTRIAWGHIFYLEYCYTDKKDYTNLKNKYNFWYKILWRINFLLPPV